jgi:hypothetical protein
MTHLFKVLSVLMALFILSGCSITQKVEPVPADTIIDKLWIEDNPTAKHDTFDEEVAESIRKLGFDSEVFPKKQQPENSTFILKYYVRWQWDLALYLKEFRATLFENNKEIGSIVYDATAGGGNMGKFGTTMSKVNPLLQQLLQNARPGTAIQVKRTSETKEESLEQKLIKLKELYSKGLITENEYTAQKHILLKQIKQ